MDALKPHSFISICYKPREAVRYLTSYQFSSLSHFRMIAGLAFIYLLQIAFFLLLSKSMPISAFLTLKGLNAIFWFFLLFIGVLYVNTNILTLAIWICAKWLKGHSTLPLTRTALLWTMTCCIPLGFFCLLLQYTFIRTDLGLAAIIIKMISYMGLFATLIYGFIVMVKTISETQGFGIWRAFISCIFGIATQFAIIFAIVIFLRR